MELQERQDEFYDRDAALVVIGAGPEPRDLARQNANEHGITYPLLYDVDTRITQQLGLWSEQMQMPFMGYVIIDKTGHIVAGEQVLSEAPGSESTNVDHVLEALERSQEASNSSNAGAR